MARLTDKTLAQSTAITPTTLIHIVTTADVTQNPAGSSFKAQLSQLASLFTGGTSGSGTSGTSGINGTSGSSGTSGVGGLSINPYNNSGSGSTITWEVSGQSTNYEATLTATTTLNLTGVTNGHYGTIILTQDSVGGRTISLGTINGASGTHRVANGGGGTVALTINPNAVDILTFTYNGSIMYWTVGNDYT
jgi:hypothetical protein